MYADFLRKGGRLPPPALGFRILVLFSIFTFLSAYSFPQRQRHLFHHPHRLLVSRQTRSVIDDLRSRLCDAHKVLDEQQPESSPVFWNHVVLEDLRFQPRPHTGSMLKSVFLERACLRSKKIAPKDKIINYITTLPGTPGSGKSTFLAHFPASPEYQEYVSTRRNESEGFKASMKRPLVSLFTFNSAMSFQVGKEAVGLRIIFGALKATIKSTEDWSEFLETYASLKDIDAVDAVKLLREIFGNDRLMFIGVDELSKIEDRKVTERIISQLGALLCDDGYTDVLVTALSPAFVEKLVTASNRLIRYVPILPLNKGELDDEFKSTGLALANQVEDELEAVRLLSLNGTKYKPMNSFTKCILQNLHLLASGHPRSVEMLKAEVDDGTVFNRVKPCLVDIKPIEPLDLIVTHLSKLYSFSAFCKLPEDDDEREIILSVSARDVVLDAKVRAMVEGQRCFFFEQLGGPRSAKYRVTTQLAIFFQMLQTIQGTTELESVGTLSRAAGVLIPNFALSLSQLWERVHALTIVSRMQQLEWRSFNKLFAVDDVWFEGIVTVGGDLAVVLAVDKASMQWKANTLFVAPDNNPGFDLLTCLLGEHGEKVFVYQEVKIQQFDKKGNDLQVVSHEEESVGDLVQNFTAVVGKKLTSTLTAHVQQHTNTTGQSREMQLAALRHVYFLLSVYGCELGNHKSELKVAVQNYLQEQRDKSTNGGKSIEEQKAEIDLVLAFVEQFWDCNVAFQGTKEMEASMIPVVLPIAQLVQVCENRYSNRDKE